MYNLPIPPSTKLNIRDLEIDELNELLKAAHVTINKLNDRLSSLEEKVEQFQKAAANHQAPDAFHGPTCSPTEGTLPLGDTNLTAIRTSDLKTECSVRTIKEANIDLIKCWISEKLQWAPKYCILYCGLQDILDTNPLEDIFDRLGSLVASLKQINEDMVIHICELAPKKGKGKPTAEELSEAEVKRLLLKGQELGSGAYGTAYKVLHKGKPAVLKVAIEDLWQVRAAFRNEAKTLQELQGAGGAPMLLGTCSKPTAILMDYCCGQEFYSFIYDSKTLPSLALRALPDIARRLQEIHLAGYIHADLKTDNVMVNEQVQPRIIDFGLAVKKGRKIKIGQNISDSIYAPEYTRGAPAQPWGDVYSMGCLVDDTIYALYDDIPKDYENIIKMAKNINPKLRPTVPELVDQLEAAWLKQNLQ
ncbi:probable serine/threonine-protein kinase DDB_G0267514 [Macrobrachium nipponense]|uniref:probable serine/threonine-protein kinase DDB_G0267514 n=1 Tax=Macrobrachium nipponense TaxID=159736 RepID=UPI0030C85291